MPRCRGPRRSAGKAPGTPFVHGRAGRRPPTQHRAVERISDPHNVQGTRDRRSASAAPTASGKTGRGASRSPPGAESSTTRASPRAREAHDGGAAHADAPARGCFDAARRGADDRDVTFERQPPSPGSAIAGIRCPPSDAASKQNRREGSARPPEYGDTELRVAADSGAPRSTATRFPTRSGSGPGPTGVDDDPRPHGPGSSAASRGAGRPARRDGRTVEAVHAGAGPAPRSPCPGRGFSRSSRADRGRRK